MNSLSNLTLLLLFASMESESESESEREAWKRASMGKNGFDIN
jgi:hypothetical protein